MWLSEIPVPDSPLRQGDLLVDVPRPILRLPVKAENFLENQPMTVVPVETGPAIVISQCCTNENSKHVVIASVRRRGGLQPHERAALLKDEPDIVDGALHNYTLDSFALKAYADVLESLDEDHFWVAELSRMTAFVGDDTSLKDLRRAQMEPEERRLLRIKLAHRWARPEESDAQHLMARGIPPGPTP